ncbi:MAG: Na/Pi symporter, partial [Rhizobiaceae bacterium]
MILLHLAGAVALLLWATRMVRSGFERLIGPRERSAIREALKNRLTAAASGLFLAVLFQSATAVALLVTGFAGQGVVGVPAGISALLGADLGSAIAARLLSFDLEPLVPLLLLAGTIVAMISEDRPWRQAGRILIGLGL